MSTFRVLTAVLAMVYFQQASAGNMTDLDTKNNFNGLYLGLGTGFTTLSVSDNFAYSLSAFPTSHSSSIHFTETDVLFEGHIGYGSIDPTQNLSRCKSRY